MTLLTWANLSATVAAMRLAVYLEKNHLTAAEFARRVGTTRQAVSAWLNYDQIPRPEIMGRIKEETKGKVTADDFFSQAAEASG